MKIYVHIGSHKTGTTSVQVFLRRHAEALAKAGIWVPEAATPDPLSGHHNLAWELREDPRYKPARGGLKDLLRELAASPAAAAVVSSEDLEYLVDDPGRLAQLDAALTGAGHEPNYIFFTRRADSYALSLHAELQAHGLRSNFPRFVGEILRTGKFVMQDGWSFYFDADSFADRWRQAAASPLRVYSYEAAVAGEGLVPFFLSLIGAPADLVEPGRRAEILNTRKPGSRTRVSEVLGCWLLRQGWLMRPYR